MQHWEAELKPQLQFQSIFSFAKFNSPAGFFSQTDRVANVGLLGYKAMKKVRYNGVIIDQ